MKSSEVDLQKLKSNMPKDKFISMDCGNVRIVITSDPISISGAFDDVHSQYEFFIPLTAFSSAFIDNKKIACEPGNLLVINPGQNHGLKKNVRRASFISLFFSSEYMRNVLNEIVNNIAPFPNYVQTIKPEIQKLILVLIEEYRERKVGRDAILRALSDQLAVQLIRTYHNPLIVPKHITDKTLDVNQSRFSVVVDYMNSHLEDKITIEQMADLVMMNRFHFIRSFRNAFGSSPYDFLTDLRIERAKQLLSNTRLSASEIGKRCGYFSASRFSAAFKSLTGMTPSKYRQQILLEQKHLSAGSANKKETESFYQWESAMVNNKKSLKPDVT